MVVWDRADHILEAEKHRNDKQIYKEIKFNENIVTGLVEKSNKIFSCLCSHRLISENEFNYASCKFKACVYFLSNLYFSLNDSPSKTMKNVFFFI